MKQNKKQLQVNSGRPADTTAPTVVITCAQVSGVATTPLNFTFTFSEAVTGFVVGDITVVNGSAGNFAGSGAVYTADITPTGMSVITVDVAAGDQPTERIIHVKVGNVQKAEGNPGLQPGLDYRYFEGNWQFIPNLTPLTPAKRSCLWPCPAVMTRWP